MSAWDARNPMLPTMGHGASQASRRAAYAVFPCTALTLQRLAPLRPRTHYRATRFQFGSKFLFKHLEPPDSPERRMLLGALNERDYPIFDHEQRAGDDDSWIYAFDARRVGDALPPKKLGPWDFRARRAALDARKQIAMNLWTPAKSLNGGRKVTRDEVAHPAHSKLLIIIRTKSTIHRREGHHPGGHRGENVRRHEATAEFETSQQAAAKHCAFLRRELVDTVSTLMVIPRHGLRSSAWSGMMCGLAGPPRSPFKERRMRTLRHLAMIIGTVITLSACAPAAPPPVDTAAEEAALKAITAAWLDAHNAGDVEKIVAMYTEDAVLMAPHAAVATGHAGIRAFLTTDTAAAKAAGRQARPGGPRRGRWRHGLESGSYPASRLMRYVDGGSYLSCPQSNGKWLRIRDTITRTGRCQRQLLPLLRRSEAWADERTLSPAETGRSLARVLLAA